MVVLKKKSFLDYFDMIQEQKKNSVTVSATVRSSLVILSPRLSFSLLSYYLIKFPSRERERESE